MKEEFVFPEKTSEDLVISFPAEKDGTVSDHFGHAPIFKFYKIDKNEKKIVGEKEVVPPEHAPGVIPIWVAKMGADVIMSGGMGQMAVNIFQDNGIEVIIGVNGQDSKQLIEDYLNGTLKTTGNACSH